MIYGNYELIIVWNQVWRQLKEPELNSTLEAKLERKYVIDFTYAFTYSTFESDFWESFLESIDKYYLLIKPWTRVFGYELNLSLLIDLDSFKIKVWIFLGPWDLGKQ